MEKNSAILWRYYIKNPESSYSVCLAYTRYDVYGKTYLDIMSELKLLAYVNLYYPLMRAYARYDVCGKNVYLDVMSELKLLIYVNSYYPVVTDTER